MKRKNYSLLLGVQLLVILLAGIFSKDAGFAIAISLIGICFNFLVSLNQPVGFLFGCAYALTNGMMAYETQIYATFVFMIFIQAPISLPCSQGLVALFCGSIK
ncbi:MAG: hypothetical protein RR448_10015 [Niameybacter sp.]|uniref:hypothetical protein n=1 Tax=Niameybacter sp. TaxID=2033640 RepID=UPI002FC92E14